MLGTMNVMFLVDDEVYTAPIDGTVLPNANLMLNSDAVWIQSNAIGHAFYYKILDVTRTHSIPLEYFTYASAEKCAEQIVEYDKNIKD